MRTSDRLNFALALIISLGFMGRLPSERLVQRAHATTLKPLTLGALTRLSAFVFRGEVLSREVTRTSSGAIWTRYRISVLSPWRGALAPRDVIHLDIQGGMIERDGAHYRQEIHGQPKLEPLQQGVFFLERAASGRLVFTGMSQGWFPVSRQGGVAWAERDPQIRAHLYRGSSRRDQTERFVGAPLNLERIKLSSLKRIVTRGVRPPEALPNSATLSVEGHKSLSGSE